jgi:sodium/proline symporter
MQFLEVPKPTVASGVWGAIAVALMLLFSLWFGLMGRRRWATFDEYMVGQRTMGPIITGAAVAAAYLSGWAFCGSAGITYTFGWSGMWFAGVWTLVGIMPCVWFTALRTRELSAAFGATTLPELLGRRFDSKLLQTVISIVMLVFLFMYSIGQLKAAGGVWYVATGWSPLACLLVAVLVTWVYMALGGYTSSQWAMGFQGAVIGAVGLIMGILAIVKIGGPIGLNQKLVAENPVLIKLIRPDLPKVGPTQLFSSLVGVLACPVLFFTMAIGFPHNVSRFLGMRELTKRDYAIMCFFVWLIAGVPIMMDCAWNGLVSRALYGPKLLKIEPWKADLANPMVAWALGGIPLLAAYVAGLFAAALSTLAAMVFIMAGNVTRDLIKLWRPQTSDKTLIWLLRILLGVFLFIPFLYTFYKPPALLALFMGQAAIALGGIFFFVTAISYYWKRATKWGAIAACIYGTVMTLWGAFQIAQKKLGMGSLLWIVVIGCGICYFLVSLLTRPPREEVLNKAFPQK